MAKRYPSFSQTWLEKVTGGKSLKKHFMRGVIVQQGLWRREGQVDTSLAGALNMPGYSHVEGQINKLIIKQSPCRSIASSHK